MEKWIDYSSLLAFMKCPRSYWWRYVQHVAPVAESPALINGKAYHDALASYYKALKDGKSSREAEMDAFRTITDSKLMEVKDDPKRNINVAIETLGRYFSSWKDGNLKVIEVDIGFGVSIGDVVFVGKIDLVAETPFGIMIVEHKTTSVMNDRWLSRAKPSLQIDGYVAAYYLTTGVLPAGGILDIIPISEKKQLKPSRVYSMRSLHDIEIWMINIQMWYNFIEKCYESSFPQNTENCVPLMGSTCVFHKLCSNYPIPWEGYELPDEFKVEKWEPWNMESV